MQPIKNKTLNEFVFLKMDFFGRVSVTNKYTLFAL